MSKEVVRTISINQMNETRLKTIGLFLTQACFMLCFIMFSSIGKTYAGGSVDIDNPEITGNYYANFREDRRNVSIIEYDGDYDKATYEARMVVAKEFYKEHPDTYDFLVVFTSFEFDSGNALAFHNRLQNNIQGLGLPAYDSSSFYGSQGKLKGYTDMAALSRYRSFDPQDPGFEQVINVLGHEALHQWGTGTKFIDDLGNVNSDLIDGEGHWVSNFNLGGSLHHVPQWLDNGDGTYTANPDTTFTRTNIFSPLDLYNMGLYEASEVPPMQLLKLDAPLTKGVPAGTTITATPVEISIEQIIAANGQRIPAAADSQKEFHFGFIYLTKPGEQVTEATFTQINEVRENFEQRFSILTGGRAVAQVYPEGISGENTGTPDVIVGDGVRDRPPEIEEGLQWIQASQNTDGFWSDKTSTQLRDTSVILALMNQVNSSFDGYTSAVDWLLNAEANTADHLARKIIGLEASGVKVPQLKQQLINLQNEDGGWGITDDYSSDILDTSLAIRALGTSAESITDAGLAFLNSVKNLDNAWGYVIQGQSNIYVTTEVMRAFAAADNAAGISQASLDWVISHQNLDGGYGDTVSTSIDTANVILAFIEIDKLDLIQPELASFYLSSQQDNQGSWSGSVYTTAMAALAFQNANFPNLIIPDSITSKPVQVYDGDTLKFTWEVANNSGQFSEASLARAYLGDPLQGGVQIGEDFLLPAIGPNSSVTLSTFWDSLEMSGQQSIYFVADPDNTIAEINEGDNTRRFDVVVEEAPAGVELSISDNDIAILPQMPNSLPVNLGVLATVRNNGWTDAQDLVVRLVKSSNSQTQILEDKVISIPGRSSMAINFAYNLTEPGESVFHIILDPDDLILEENEENNTASSTVTTQASIDLSVINADISLSEEPAIVNSDVVFTVNLHNYGTVQSPTANVNYIISDGVNSEIIQTNMVNIGPGQSIEQLITWRVDRLGDLSFSVQLDPDNQIAETQENNNAATRDFVSSTQDGINLSVTFDNFFIDPNPLLEGQPATLRASVSNSGSLDASNVSVNFYQGDPANGGVLLGEATIASIPTGESREASVVWANVDVTANQLLVVVVDEQNAIAEFDEEDNSAFNVLLVKSLADLAVSNADISVTPSFPVLGDSLVVNVKVTNLGMQPVTSDISLYAGKYSEGDTPVATQTHAFAADSTQVLQFNWDYTTESNALQLSVAIDPENLIEEGDKANNTASLYISTQNSDLYVTEKYISPNEDGKQDETVFFFRSNSGELINNIYVVDAETRNLVKTLSLESATDFGNAVWDGRDEYQRIVPDGEYIITTKSDYESNLDGALVVVDTNRSPVMDAYGTDFGIYTDYTIQTGKNNSRYSMTDDEKYVFLTKNKVSFFESSGQSYDGGLYRVDEFGGSVKTIIPATYYKFASARSFSLSAATSNSNGSYVHTRANISPEDTNASSYSIELIAKGDGSEIREFDLSVSGTNVSFWGFIDNGKKILAEHYLADTGKRNFYSIDIEDFSQYEEIISVDDYYYVEISPNGRYIAYNDESGPDPQYGGEGILKIYDSQTGNTSDVVQNANNGEAIFGGILWSPDSSKLLVYYDWGFNLEKGFYHSTRFASVYKNTGEEIMVLRGLLSDDEERKHGSNNVLINEGTDYEWSSFSNEIVMTLFSPDVYYCSENFYWNIYIANTDKKTVYPVAAQDTPNYYCSDSAGPINKLLSLDLEGPKPILINDYSYPWHFDWLPSERKIIRSSYTEDNDDMIVIDLDKFEKGFDTDSVEILPFEINGRRWEEDIERSPGQKRVLFGQTPQYSFATGPHESLYSLQNLTADLRALRSNSAGGFVLKGTATDKQMSHYTLEYAFLNDKENWFTIQPAQTGSNIDDIFTTWVPPKADTYLIRLTSFDKAGNSRDIIKRVNWNSNPSITDVYRDPPFFSPDGNGVNDETEIHYRVLEPVHLEFEIYNSDGELVDTIIRDHIEIGQEFSIFWDGRTQAGIQLPDGEYTILIEGNAFGVYLDRLAPVTEVTYQGPYQTSDGEREFPGEGKYLWVDPASTILINPSIDDYQSIVIEQNSAGSDEWLLIKEYDDVTVETALNNETALSYAIQNSAETAYRIVAKDKAGNTSVTAASQFHVQPIIEAMYVVPDYDVFEFQDTRKSGESVPYAPITNYDEYIYGNIPYIPYDSSVKKVILSVQENIPSEIVNYIIEYKPSNTNDWLALDQKVLLESVSKTGNVLNIGNQIDSIKDGLITIGFDRTETYLVSNNIFRVKLVDLSGNEFISNPIGIQTGILERAFNLRGIPSLGKNPLHDEFSNFPIATQIVINGNSDPSSVALFGDTDDIELVEVGVYVQSTQDPSFILPRKLLDKAVFPDINSSYAIRTNQLKACTAYTGYAVGLTLLGEEIESGKNTFKTACNDIEYEVGYPLGETCDDIPTQSPMLSLRPVILDSSGSVYEGYKLLELFTLDTETNQETLVDNRIEPTVNQAYTFDLSAYLLDENKKQLFIARLTDNADLQTQVEISVANPGSPVSINISSPLNNTRICAVNSKINAEDTITTIEAEIRNAADGVIYNNYLLDPISGEKISALTEVDSEASKYSLASSGCTSGLSSNLACGSSAGLVNGKIAPPKWNTVSKTHSMSFKNLNKDVSILTEIFNKSGEKVCNQHDFFVDGSVEFSGLRIDNNILSPDGDGIFDDLTFTFEQGEATNITAVIYSLTDNGDLIAPVETLFSNQQFLDGESSYTWNGLTSSGSVLADGKYALVLKVVDGCGLEIDLSKEDSLIKPIKFTYDTTPPLVSIATPTNGQSISLIAAINGQINDFTLSNYSIEYGLGLVPENWVGITSVINASNINGLLANWNTYGLTGDVTLRITASDKAGHQSIVQLPVSVDTEFNFIKYLEPLPTLFSANGDGKRDEVSIRYGLDNEAKVSLTVNLVGSATVVRTLRLLELEPAGDKIVNWDGLDVNGLLVADGSYEISLKAEFPDNEFISQTESAQVELDATQPFVELTEPLLALSGYINSEETLKGTVTDKNLTNYTITLTDTVGGNSVEILAGENQFTNSVLGDLSEFPDSKYRLSIDAFDAAESQTNFQHDLVIDTLPPELAIVTPLNNQAYGVGDLEISILASHFDVNIDSYSIRYGLGKSPLVWLPLANEMLSDSSEVENLLNIESLEEGVYTIEYVLRDKAENDTTTFNQVIIDRTAPLVSFSSHENADYVNNKDPISVNVIEENVLSYELAYAHLGVTQESSFIKLVEGTNIDGAGFEFVWSNLPADGSYILRTTVTDVSENVGTELLEVVVDLTPPDAPQNLVGGYDKNQNGVSLSWSENIESDLAGYSIYRDSVLVSDTLQNSNDYLDLITDEDTFQYSVTAKDLAGNESEASPLTEVAIDLTAPEVRLFNPKSGDVISGQIDIIGTATSASDFKEYRLSAARTDDLSSSVLINKSPVSIVASELGRWNTFGLDEGTNYIIRLEVEDFNENISSEEISVSVDNTPPAAPTGLTLSRLESDITLNWNPNAEPDIQGYIVFRNDDIANADGIVLGDIAQFSIPSNSYTDSSLGDDAYTYYVIAIDQAGNISEPSTTVYEEVEAGAPTATIVSPVSGLNFDEPIQVKAVSMDQDVIEVSFEYSEVLPEPVWVQFASSTELDNYQSIFNPVELNLVLDTSYYIRAVATDKTGNTDASPQFISVNYKDITSPGSVISPSLQVNAGDVTLSWSAPDDTDLAGYRVFRKTGSGNLVLITLALVTETTFTDLNAGDNNYQYKIKSYDLKGNFSLDESDEILDALVYTPSVQQPSSPRTNTELNLSGNSPVIGDLYITTTNSGVTSELPKLRTTDSGDFEYFIQLGSGDNIIDVKIVDPLGNTSKTLSLILTVGTSPSAPTGLVASSSIDTVSLEWNDNPETDIFGYIAYRDDIKLQDEINAPFDGVIVPDNPNSAQNIIDGNLSSYWYSYQGRYQRFNGSEVIVSWNAPKLVNSLVVNWRYSFTRPSLYRIEANVNGNWQTLKIFESTSGTVDEIKFEKPFITDKFRIVVEKIQKLTTYPIQISEISATEIPLVTDSMTLDSSPEIQNGSFAYTVSAVNILGLEGPQSDIAEVSNGDFTAPNAVTLSANTNDTNVELQWTLSDASDFLAYHLYRDDELIADVLDINELTYLDIVTVNGDYTYSIIVEDALGNLSDASSTHVTVVLAVLPAPENLTAIDSGDGQNIILNWQASSGDVVSYRLYRSEASGNEFTEIYTGAETTYSDDSVIDNIIYYYVAVAVDVYGYESSYSNEASALLVDSFAPDTPVILLPTISGQAITTENEITSVSGVAEPGSNVNLFLNGDFYAQTSLPELATTEVLNRKLAQYSYLQSVSPDGKYTDEYDYAQIFNNTENLSEKEHALIDQFPYNYIDLVGFSSDSSRMYFYYYDLATDQSILAAYIFSSREITDILRIPVDFNQSNQITQTAVSADRNSIYVAGNYNTQEGMWKHTVSTNSWELIFPFGSYSFRGQLKLSPDDKKLVTGINQSPETVVLIDLESNAVTYPPIDSNGYAGVHFSPDSKKLLFSNYDSLINSDSLFVYDISTAISQKLPILGELDSGQYGWLKGSSEVGYLSYSLTNPSASDVRSYNLDTNTHVNLLSNVIYENFYWLNTGQALYQNDKQELIKITPSDTFVFPYVDLEIGTNVITATSTDRAGNTSDISDSIIINYEPTLGYDLKIADSDIQISPASILVDSNARITVRIHNNGTEISGPSQFKLLLVKPDGSHDLLQDLLLTSIEGQSSVYQYYDFESTNELGKYYFIAQVESENAIPEIDENNNLGVQVFNVLNNLDPVINLFLDRVEVNSGQAITGGFELFNPSAQVSGLVKVVIEDANGYLVEELQSSPVVLGANSTSSTSISWNSKDILDGDYVVRTTLFNSDASEIISESSQTFEIKTVSEFTLTINTDLNTYSSFENVNINSSITYAVGNGVVSNSIAEVRILDSLGNELDYLSFPIGSLVPSQVLPLNSSWNTGLSDNGQYTASLSFMTNGVLSNAVETQFEISESLDNSISNTTGDITLSNSYVKGQDAKFILEVLNNSNQALIGLDAELIITSNNVVVDSASRVLDVEKGTNFVDENIFTTDEWSIGDYQVELRLVSSNISLSTKQFRLRDRTIPTVSLSSPDFAAIVNKTSKLLLAANDADSIIDLVEISFDSGVTWKQLELFNQAESIYSLDLNTFVDNSYTAIARSLDSEGNQSDILNIAFEIDTILPVIEIAGISNGDYVAESVLASVTALDQNLQNLVVELNDEIVNDANSINIIADGEYTLSAYAIDAAGNISSQDLSFVIDTLQPVITVTGVEDNTFYATAVTPRILVTDDNLSTTEVVLNGQIIQDYSTLNIDVDGEYTLVVTAFDFAENEQNVSVYFVVDIVAPLLTVNPIVESSDTTPLFSGTTDQPDGSEVLVQDSMGTTLCTAIVTAGAWSCESSVELSDGEANLVISTADESGNTTTETLSVSIDTTAPLLTVNPITESSDSTPLFSGTTDQPDGSEVFVQDSTGTTICTAIVASGGWSCESSVELSDGETNLVISTADESGNPTTETLSVSVDTTAPLLTVNPIPESNDNTPLLSGTTDQPDGSEVLVQDSMGTTLCTAIVTAGVWSCESSVELTDGTNELVISTRDASGNTTTESLSVSVDTTAPLLTVNPIAESSDSTPLLRGTTDQPDGSEVVVQDSTGTSICTAVVTAGIWSCESTVELSDGDTNLVISTADESGNTTTEDLIVLVDTTSPLLTVNPIAESSDTTPLFSGTTDQSDSSEVLVQDSTGTTICTAVVTEGAWSCESTVELPDGETNLVISTADESRNTTTETLSVSVDTTAPLLAVNPIAESSDTTPLFSGTTDQPDGSEVLVQDSTGTTFCTAIVASGAWSCESSFELSDGETNLVISTADESGNTTTETVTVSVDTTAPLLTVNPIAESSDTTPLFSGTTDQPDGSEVVVQDSSGTTICMAVVASGIWSCESSFELPDGTNELVISTSDASGNTTTESLSVSVDTTAPLLTVNPIAESSDTTPLFSGTTDQSDGSEVLVQYSTGTTICTAIVASGAWSCESSIELSDGETNLVISTADESGNTTTETVTVSVDTTAPLLTVNPITESSVSTPLVSGTTDQPDGSEVVVQDSTGTTLCTAIVSAGVWSCESGIELNDGTNELIISTSDASGNTTTENLSISVDTTAPLLTVNPIAESSDTTPLFTGTTDQPDGSEVVVQDSTGTILCTAIVTAGVWSCESGIELNDGTNELVISTSDASVNTTTETVTVSVDTTAPLLTVNPIAESSDTTPLFSGTTDQPDGSEVVVQDSTGTTLCTAVVALDTWSCESSVELPLGESVLAVSTKDDVNNSTTVDLLVIVASDGILDSDGDGIPDSIERCSDKKGSSCPDESFVDTDLDTIPDYLDLDSDNDDIPDSYEAGDLPETPVDTDKDGIPDYCDLDSDNDEISDQFEAGDGDLPRDTDADGIDDFRDEDSDNDGIKDIVEGQYDLDHDGYENYRDLDTDGDGLSDYLEAGDNRNHLTDSDNDSLPDYLETNDIDTDGDGLVDAFDKDDDGDKVATASELGPRPSEMLLDRDHDGIPDYLELPQHELDENSDADGDGILDKVECPDGYLCPDSDNNFIPDYLDLDSDNDGLSDDMECGAMSCLDSDNDGLADYKESNVIDSDYDGINDYLDSDDDNDGIQTIDEISNLGIGADSDGDGLPDFLDSILTSDTDSDGRSDSAECGLLMPCPDTDDDGLADYLDKDDDDDGIPSELELEDSDLDGLIDAIESNVFDYDVDGILDYLDSDDDGDGILTKDESFDSDADSISDYYESNTLDSDGDGIKDNLDADDDNDGIQTLIEINEFGSKYTDKDGDGIPDYLDGDVDSTNSGDTDKDGVTDAKECASGFPCGDIDKDGVPDYADKNLPCEASGNCSVGAGIKSSGGGSIGWSSIFLMLLLFTRRKYKLRIYNERY